MNWAKWPSSRSLSPVPPWSAKQIYEVIVQSSESLALDHKLHFPYRYRTSSPNILLLFWNIGRVQEPVEPQNKPTLLKNILVIVCLSRTVRDTSNENIAMQIIS